MLIGGVFVISSSVSIKSAVILVVAWIISTVFYLYTYKKSKCNWPIGFLTLIYILLELLLLWLLSVILI